MLFVYCYALFIINRRNAGIIADYIYLQPRHWNAETYKDILSYDTDNALTLTLLSMFMRWWTGDCQYCHGLAAWSDCHSTLVCGRHSLWAPRSTSFVIRGEPSHICEWLGTVHIWDKRRTYHKMNVENWAWKQPLQSTRWARTMTNLTFFFFSS